MSYDRVLDIFSEITTIPRPSGHEQQIRNRLINRADRFEYPSIVDAAGNLIIRIPSSGGHKFSPTCILQAHMDMVCVKTPGSTHDFTKDRLQLQEKDGRLTATETTLGADNGMGIAMILACVESHDHPPLELLFTIDEERGLVGALTFDPEALSGKYLINLDTEDEGEICISSAGGGRLTASCPMKTTENTYSCYRLVFDGLPGGHSGVDIHDSRGNAVLALAEFLISQENILSVVSMHGGQADNAIPGSAEAVIATSSISELEKAAQQFVITYQARHGLTSMTARLTELPLSSSTLDNRKATLTHVLSIPNGVQEMSKLIDGLVQTSLNLGVFAMSENGLSVTHAMRSSVYQHLLDLLEKVQTAYQTVGCYVIVKNVYPGRQESPKSKLLKIAKEEYQKVLGRPVKVVAYHAGLECGAIVERLEQEVSAISFGPTIKDPHSPHERVYLPSVKTTYQTLCHILERL